MKNIKKYSFTIIIALICVILFIAYFYIKFYNYSKENNLYNIKNYKIYNEYIKSKGIAIFDEHVFENFNNTNINLNNFTVHRTESEVSGTNNFDAIDKANSLLNINNSDINIENSFNKTIENILFDNYAKLNLNYFNNGNYNSNSQDLRKEIKKFADNKNIVVSKSGYYMNFYDGYETLFDLESFDLTDLNEFDNIFNNKVKKNNGVKYVNNRYYYIITRINDFNNYDRNNFDFINLIVNNKSYTGNLYKTKIFGDDAIVVFKLYEGIEDVIENRFLNIKINLNKVNSFIIPKSSILEYKGVTGVYFLKDGIIKFAPIKVLKDYDDKYILISSEVYKMFPRVINKLSLNFEELHSFDKLIVHPEKYSEGDKY